MSYSRRQLYALGETLGECVTRKEGGRVVYGGGGSGGGGAPAQQTQISDLPEWAKPYAQRTLGMGEALTTEKDKEGNITGPAQYQTYGGQRMEPFDPLQQRAYQGVGGMQTSPQLGVASNIAQAAALRGLGAQYEPGYFENQFEAPAEYQPARFNYMNVNAPALRQYQMGPAERASAQSFLQPGTAESYMSPFMEQALKPQLREAQRSSELQRQANQAQAVQAGAFGGARSSLMESQRLRNLAQQQGDIRARGMQTAFEQGQGQFNTEQQARMQAQLANQQAGLTVGGQNLAAQLGIQQLGSGQNMQAQLANQQAYQDMLRQREASRQFGAGQGMTAAQLRAQYGLAGQQLGEQSRQFGAGYGQQGLSTAIQGAGQLGQLGGQQFGQQKDIYDLQNRYGEQARSLRQQDLSQQYQDFLNQQRHPYQQLEFLSGLLRGTPMGTVNTMYAQQPSMASQLAGLGLAGAGMYNLTRKKGGVVKSKKPAGLAELALSKMGA